jgi:hypothetical protein
MRLTFGAKGARRPPEPFGPAREQILNDALRAEAVPDLAPPVNRPARMMALLEDRNVNNGRCDTYQMYSTGTVRVKYCKVLVQEACWTIGFNFLQ